MALYNILSPTDQVEDSQGRPLGGGFVFLYEPGTTSFITSYKDSGLVVPHTNPVRLSGSGRANIWVSRDCDVVVQDRNGNTILTIDNANPDALGAGESSGLVPNGSFEIDADADTVPDGWALVSEAGSSNAIDTSTSTDGAQCFRFTSTGAGGGSLTTDDFFPVNDADNLRVNVDLQSTVANVRNIVRVEWYDISQVSISDSDAYDSTANPLTWTTQNLSVAPPVGARFAKLRLIGVDPSVALAGITYFDKVQVFYPAVVSGVFDNITIQNNQIVTTNIDGDLEIAPNGNGSVNINQGNLVDLVDTENPLNIGTDNPDANPHLAVSLSQVQAKTDATTSAALYLNNLGGAVQVGDATSRIFLNGRTDAGLTTPVALANSDNALNVGSATPSSAPHIAMDFDTIQGKNAAAASELKIQTLGTADLTMGSSSGGSTRINNRLDLREDADVTLTNALNALNIGGTTLTADPHLAVSTDIIQAKATSLLAADLNINPLGGDVFIGASGDVTLGQGVGTVQALGMLHASQAGGVDLTDTTNALNTGGGDPASNPHIAFGNARIQAKADATTAAQLRLQELGGDLALGSATTIITAANMLQASGAGTVSLADVDNPLNIGPSLASSHLALDSGTIQAKATGTTAGALVINSLGGDTDIGPQSGSGLVKIYQDAQLRFNMANNAFLLRSSTLADPTLSEPSFTSIQLQDSAGVIHGYLGFVGGQTLQVYNVNYGSDVLLRGTDLLGTAIECARFDPDADSEINYAGTVRIRTSSAGMTLTTNALNTTLNTTSFAGYAENRLDTPSGGATFRVVQPGGGLEIWQTNGGTTLEDLWLRTIRNGEVILYNNNNQVAKTDSAANGGFQVNNTLTGAGYERVLTESDLITGGYIDTGVTSGPGVYYKIADTARNFVGTPNNDNHLDAATSLDGSAYYKVTAFLMFKTPSNTCNVKVQVNVSTGLSGWSIKSADENSTVGGEAFLGSAEESGSFQKSYNLDANLARVVEIEGFAIFTSGGAASRTISIAWGQDTLDAGNDLTLQRGSYLTIEKIADI